MLLLFVVVCDRKLLFVVVYNRKLELPGFVHILRTNNTRCRLFAPPANGTELPCAVAGAP